MKRRIPKTRLLLSALVWIWGVFSFTAWAQVPQVLEIPSKIMGESRQATVYLPEGYDNSEQVYAVLYVPDGARYGNVTAAIAQELAATGQIPPLVVVGISLGQADAELRQNVPYRNQFSPEELKGDDFLSYLKEELIPEIDRQYRTAPYRLVGGHGQSAFFTLTALMTQPETFHAYLAAAPPLYQLSDPERLYREFLVGHMDFNGSVYITTGFGDDGMMAETLKLTRLMKAHSVERPMEYHFELLEEETNQSAYLPTLHQGLKSIFADTRRPNMLPHGGISAIWDLHGRLMEKYGYDPIGLELLPYAFTQEVPASTHTSSEEMAAKAHFLLASELERYDTDPLHLYNLMAFWKSKGEDAHAEALGGAGAKSFPQQKSWFRLSGKNGPDKANQYGDGLDLERGQVIHLDMESETPGQVGITVLGATQTTEGKVGSAQAFDGKGSKWQLQLASFANHTGSFTFAAWVWPEATPPFRRFIAKPREDGKPVWQVGYGPLGDNQWGLTAPLNGYKDYWVNDALPLREWAHLAVVADQSLGVVRYYRNGEFIGEVAQLLPFAPAEEGILLGCQSSGRGFFEGKIDEIYLYDRGLGLVEIKALYEKK